MWGCDIFGAAALHGNSAVLFFGRKVIQIVHTLPLNLFSLYLFMLHLVGVYFRALSERSWCVQGFTFSCLVGRGVVDSWLQSHDCHCSTCGATL